MESIYARTSLILEFVKLLDERETEALARKTHRPVDASRRTLEQIARVHGVTRERIRQIESEARKEILQAIAEQLDMRVEINRPEDVEDLVRVAEFCDLIEPSSQGAIAGHEVLRFFGYKPTSIDRAFWTSSSQVFDQRVKALEIKGPIAIVEWQEMIAGSGLPPELVSRISEVSVIVESSTVLRRKYERLDRLTAILRNLGGSATIDELVDAWPTAVKPHTLAEFLRRHSQFAFDRSSGRWGFSDDMPKRRFASAVEAVLEVLQQDGPLLFESLSARARALHPVSDWRIRQCCTDSRIGQLPDGRYWLVEFGAQQNVESAPTKPANMYVANHVTGVRLIVDWDILRGSGIQTNRWLAWSVGLDVVPSEMVFRSANGDFGELTLRRNHAGCSISALRLEVNRQRIGEGCVVVLLLNSERRTWSLRHSCDVDACPLN